VPVVGNSGSGKSTLAARLAAQLGVPHVELDALFHQPGWTELPGPEFRRHVVAATDGEGWVIDGNYSAVRPLVWQRADTVVWLDLPRAVVLRRIVGRTLARAILRKTLWNGNRERWRNLTTLDPEQSVIAWSWTHHAAYRERYGGAMEDPAWAHCRFVRLRSEREVDAFLAGVGAARRT
jgi:adenylate kinase family enzyme